MSLRTEPVKPARFTALRRLVEDPAHRFVVSLGGGGMPGIAGNLALVKLLEDLELRPHVEELWGTSAGAIVAGTWGSGTPPEETLEIVRSVGAPRARDVVWGRILRALLRRPLASSMPPGLVCGARIRAAIARGLRVERLENCPIPVRLIAVHDDGTMRKRVFREGDLCRCIFASMSIPGIVVPEPVDGSGETFYDGGLAEKTPLLSPVAEHTRRGDGRRLVLIGTHFDNEPNMVPARSFLARFMQTMYALEELAWEYQLREIRQRDDVTLLLLNPRLTDGSLFDVDRLVPNLEASHAVYLDRLQNAKLSLALGAH